MRKLSLLIVFFFAISFIPETAHAQKATEIFIPINASPGLSDHYTWQGTIDAVDEGNMTITVTNDTGTRNIKLTEDTNIWLDKSSLKVKNETGDFEDCKPGSFIEVKYRENEADHVAEWIKIKINP